MSRFLLLPLLAVGVCMAQPVGKVGVINVQGAIAATKDGQKAAEELNKKFGPKRKSVEDQQNAINALKDQLQKGQNTMSDTARAELVRNIDEKTKRLTRETEDAQADLQQDQQKAVQTIYEKMQVVIDKYAKDKSYTLILDVNPQQNLVVWASPSIDISKDVVALYDANTASGSPAATPANKPKN